MCFKNTLAFKDVSGDFVDENTPSLAVDNQDLAMHGQHFYAYHPATSSSITTMGTLDASGCTPAITRKNPNGSESWKFWPIVYAFVNPAIVYAVDNAGVTPGLDRTVNLVSDQAPATVTLNYTNNEHERLNTATFVSAMTVRRAANVQTPRHQRRTRSRDRGA